MLARQCSKSNKTLKGAVKALKSVPLDPPIGDPYKLIKRWAHRKTAADAGRRGRKPVVPRKLALKLARLLKRGWEDCDGQRRNLTTAKHAKAQSAEFRAAASKLKCSNRTIDRAMHREDPTLALVQEEVKPNLPRELMANRQRCCGQLYRMPLYRYKGTEWTDEASWGLCHLGMGMVSGTRGEPRLVTDPRVPKGTGEKHVLNFAISVNWTTGASTFTYLTGTKGLKHDRQYKVGCAPQGGGGPPQQRTCHSYKLSPLHCSALYSRLVSVLHTTKLELGYRMHALAAAASCAS